MKKTLATIALMVLLSSGNVVSKCRADDAFERCCDSIIWVYQVGQWMSACPDAACIAQVTPAWNDANTSLNTYCNNSIYG
jgi:hypothetical protein